MTRKLVQFEAICLTVLWAVPVLAQNQPWGPPNGAVESRVQTCTFPQPVNRIAMDDFQYDQTTKITWIRWWGVVFDPAQRSKPFYIAIWNNTTNGPCPAPCNPTSVQTSWCLTPTTKYAGLDCQNRKVYRFQVSLPAPFFAMGGTKYWLQISEDEADSARPGIEDFRWSGYRQPRLCPAQQRTAAPVIMCNINDDCAPPVATDLAYVLGNTCLGGVVLVPPLVVIEPRVFLFEIRPVSASLSSPAIHTACVEPDESGQYFLEHGLPDGNYNVTLLGMGVIRTTRMVSIQNGVGPLSFFDVFVGDLNNDSHGDGLDVQPLINGILIGL